MLFMDGNKYVGMMKEGLHDGQGTMFYHNGDIYTGVDCSQDIFATLLLRIKCC